MRSMRQLSSGVSNRFPLASAAARAALVRREIAARLCEEVHVNLAYRWFCRLGLDGDVSDHSTFSKNRHGRRASRRDANPYRLPAWPSGYRDLRSGMVTGRVRPIGSTACPPGQERQAVSAPAPRRRDQGTPGAAPAIPRRWLRLCDRAGRTVHRGRRQSPDQAHWRARQNAVQVHAHMLRHGCGYALANAGHDTRAIQDWLGHRSIQHTVRYTELAPTRFKDFWRD
jgi:Phage integrase family/Transposase domain (DUF772)